MKVRTFACIVAATLALSSPAARAADTLFISELMAVNNGTVLDEDGDSPDWIEIHNAGTNAASLNGCVRTRVRWPRRFTCSTHTAGC